MEDKALKSTVGADDMTMYGSEYAYFCRKVKDLTEINLENYKGRQMHRRLKNYMNRYGIPNFIVFAKLIQSSSTLLKDLVDFLTINVSEFFRNPKYWVTLKEKVLPKLVAHAGTRCFSAWSAGSAAGQEPYSLAITLREISVTHCTILATDIDESSLNKACIGHYSKEELSKVPVELVEKYFHPVGNVFAINSEVKRMVKFRYHNLLSSQYPNNLDLILCRNVLIYLTEEGKRHVISKLASSLKAGGVLFLGATESILAPQNYGLVQIYPFFYKRI